MNNAFYLTFDIIIVYILEEVANCWLAYIISFIYSKFFFSLSSSKFTIITNAKSQGEFSFPPTKKLKQGIL